MNNLKIGDKVVMNDKYHVSAENKGRVWTVVSDPWECCGTVVVKLEGKARTLGQICRYKVYR